MLIRTPLAPFLSQFGKNQLGQVLGPNGLPWEQGQGGRAPSLPMVPIYAVEGFTTSNYARSAANGAPDAPVVWATAGVWRSLATAANRVLFSHLNTGGWEIRATAAHAILGGHFDGGGVNRTVTSQATRTASAAVRGVLIQQRADGTLECWLDKALVATLAVVGYNGADAGARVAIGVYTAASNPATGWASMGAITGSTELSAAEIEQWFDDCAEQGDVATLPAGTTEHYSVKQSFQAVGASWPSLLTAQALTKAGTLTLYTDTDAQFSWINPDYPSGYKYRALADIMCVGDSTTVGVGQTNSNGFRGYLAGSLDGAAEIIYNLIGPAASGGGGFADLQHHGYSGDLIEDQDSGGAHDLDLSTGPGRIHQPKLVIVALGHNNVQVGGLGDSAATCATKLSSLLDHLHTLLPYARVIVSGLVWESTVGTPSDAIITAINTTEYPAVVATKAAAWTTGTIRFSQGGAGIRGAANYHPNDAGYTAWAAALYPDVRAALGWT